jgi:arginase
MLQHRQRRAARTMQPLPRPSRRALLTALIAAPIAALGCSDPTRSRRSDRRESRMLDLIDAPNHLGLRPPRPGVEPGTWRAPDALDRAGLAARLEPARHVRLARRDYHAEAQPGTRVRNGPALRDFNLELAAEVERSLGRGALPVVVGGDCSILLGCLLGLRRAGGRGLVHVDGHSDFFHPGNYDAASRLGSAAGMDLALATGRGESILTEWPGVTGPLVADADVIQIGERDAGDPGYAYRDIERTAIERVTVQTLKAEGIDSVAARANAHLGRRDLARAWLHVDLDVLDQAIMPAVDSPGSPGLTYAELSALLGGLLRSGRIAGLDVAIYDPDLDPQGTYAPRIVDAIAEAFDRLDA